jgi:hypothetical protein
MLLGLSGISAGSGALIGTGAFTSVEAERTLTVETAGTQVRCWGWNQLTSPTESILNSPQKAQLR